MNEEMSDGIRNKRLCAVTDASMLHNQIGGHWKIVDFENSTIGSKETLNKKIGSKCPKSCGGRNNAQHA